MLTHFLIFTDSTYATDVSDFSEFFEAVESKDDPRAKLLRIKQDSGLKNEHVFLVESKWPTQRLVLQGKYPLRLIMITLKHARWMLGFARYFPSSSILKSETAFLVESKRVTQRLILRGSISCALHSLAEAQMDDLPGSTTSSSPHQN
jgi:hypothetical protein